MPKRPEIPSVTVRAYAKINLTLDVLSKRSDGYHAVATAMQSISLNDTLTLALTPEPGVRFVCDAPNDFNVPTDDSNLVVRAANAFLNAATITNGVEARLEKRVPSQAGLGGGSSDAAATLRGLQELIPDTHDETAIRTLAAELGSDVPFFLTGGTAVARGRGERVQALPNAPTMWLVVVKPEESVSTAWAYGALDALPDRTSHRGTARIEEAIRAADLGRIVAFQCNDFEQVVYEAHSKIAWLADELTMAGALTAHLCGSGSAVYGIATDEPTARRIAGYFDGRYPHVHVCRTL